MDMKLAEKELLTSLRLQRAGFNRSLCSFKCSFQGRCCPRVGTGTVKLFFFYSFIQVPVKFLASQKQEHPWCFIKLTKTFNAFCHEVFMNSSGLSCYTKKLLLYRQANTAELIEWTCFIWPERFGQKKSLTKSWSDISILEKYMETIY